MLHLLKFHLRCQKLYLVSFFFFFENSFCYINEVIRASWIFFKTNKINTVFSIFVQFSFCYLSLLFQSKFLGLSSFFLINHWE
jgi:hypothetical protein